MKPAADPVDLGWRDVQEKKKSKRRKSHSFEGEEELNMEIAAMKMSEEAVSHRRRLLKELSARLVRDKELRYAEREFEMQRQLMGKGGRKKIVGAEKVEGDSESEEDEDEIDARKGKPRKELVRKVDMNTYKPRVYKWRFERKK